ncbi:hypothetical protein BDBG_06578 [Blastomyces gilchristii SLH14081]|uniref:Uncharacterized protein n=1 Tax=Blastomyces gilchristii (strain SLH14081) TaxID=559298 RepID=A0A179URS0_BLAGS|nr:uncharacterized protein BDBG_06578 [Blastomyces gilchristii SLH14081]OAT10786.1 hypothetical protein BDBG_06578 [Blastomyces gilchristii SLH14081]
MNTIYGRGQCFVGEQQQQQQQAGGWSAVMSVWWEVLQMLIRSLVGVGRLKRAQLAYQKPSSRSRLKPQALGVASGCWLPRNPAANRG